MRCGVQMMRGVCDTGCVHDAGVYDAGSTGLWVGMVLCVHDAECMRCEVVVHDAGCIWWLACGSSTPKSDTGDPYRKLTS